MVDEEEQQKRLDLQHSVNRLVYRLCLAAAIVAGTCLLVLRTSGHLPSDEYSISRILVEAILIGVVFPVSLTTLFRVTAMPSSQIWFERLGALILFVFFPMMLVLVIVRWFTI